jgi:uncharacterized protein
MRIALVSDTHIPKALDRLPPDLLRGLDGVDAILHAGDIVSQVVLDNLSEIAPTTAVAGNMDPPELARRLNDREIIQWEGRSIGLKHGHQPHGVQSHYIDRPYGAPEMDLFFQLMSMQLPGAEIVVFGHFHRPVIREWHGVLFINPGAVASPPGRATYAILDLGDRTEARIVPLAS